MGIAGGGMTSTDPCVLESCPDLRLPSRVSLEAGVALRVGDDEEKPFKPLCWCCERGDGCTIARVTLVGVHTMFLSPAKLAC